MNVQKIFEAMNQIDPNLLKPAGLIGGVCDLERVEREIIDQTEVQKALIAYTEAFPHANGWLCRQSDVIQIHAGQLPEPAPVQYGELAGDERHSLLLRPNGAGGLRWITFEERAGRRFIAVTHRHLGRPRAPDDSGAVRNLLYRVYWDREVEPLPGGFFPAATRFTGFEGLEVTP
ncbi:hypothetical protein [Acanthopleuribacter pedis]|uniref:Uncharacterized protein n=1 Tax=Acanthopleuribacter pedis TaxID=442870 RepID=A0A8J7QLT4_9BACT|nr:hypothetical protein [Acanthopleuribacter pedis]MBO1320320.1 hypothetical protein [Acanthopleuribacter pedis]